MNDIEKKQYVRDESNGQLFSSIILMVPLMQFSVMENAGIVMYCLLYILCNFFIWALSRLSCSDVYLIGVRGGVSVLHVLGYLMIFYFPFHVNSGYQSSAPYVLSFLCLFLSGFVFVFMLLKNTFKKSVKIGRVVKGGIELNLSKSYSQKEVDKKAATICLLLLSLSMISLVCFMVFSSFGMATWFAMISVWVLLTYHVSIVFYMNLINVIYPLRARFL